MPLRHGGGECQEILTDMTDNECWMIIAGK